MSVEGLDPRAQALLEQLERRVRPTSKDRKARTPEHRAPTSALRSPPPVKPGGTRSRDDRHLDLAQIDAPPAPNTYAEALVRGGGPFGNRESDVRVVLLPSPEYRAKIAWLKHRVASTLGVDVYTAVQALQRDVPRALGSFADAAAADAAAARLAEAGVRAVVLRRSRIEAWEGPREVTSITDRDEDAVAFRLKTGEEEAVLRRHFRVAVLGRIDPDPAERASGGVLGRTAGPYTALDLLVRDDPRPLRVRSDAFDFRTLVDGGGISALVNLKSLAAEVGAPLDERFKRVPHLPALARQGDSTSSPLFLRRELELAEYVLIMDLATA